MSNITALSLLDASLPPATAAAEDELWWASDGTCNALEEDEKEKRFLYARGSLGYCRAACTPRRKRVLQAIAEGQRSSRSTGRVSYEPRPTAKLIRAQRLRMRKRARAY